MDSTLLPVFPLNTVLLPGEILPLHIFEERYKQMIGECLEAQARQSVQQEFGIVLAEGGEMQSVGCSARISKVVRNYPDGRLDILAEGRRRFEILYTNEEASYLRCGVNFFSDDGPEAPGEPEAAHALELFRQVSSQQTRTSEELPEFTPPYRYLSFRLAAALALDPGFKQELLSLRQEAARLARVVQAMNILIGQIQFSQRAQEKARGNGNTRHGVH